jgi:predicted PurR-regulated permease PerM
LPPDDDLALAWAWSARQSLLGGNFALAVLLAFAPSPIINGLRRWRVPRVAAVLPAFAAGVRGRRATPTDHHRPEALT